MFCSKCGSTVAEGAAFCTSCGAPVPAAAQPLPSSPAPATPPTAPSATPLSASPASVYASPPPQPTVGYAGFWLRFVAVLIDSLILAVPLVILFFVVFADVMPELSHNEDPFTFLFTFVPRFLVLVLIYFVGSWLYWAGMESSAWQGTLGKKALGLYVTDLNGARVNFARACARFWTGRGLGIVPYLGGLYFIISCICAGFTARKQALHDMIAGCLVLRRL